MKKNKSESGQIGIFLLVIALLVLCVFVIAGVATAVTPNTTTGEIQMVQPQAAPFGLSLENDQGYASGVNEPNSRANLNNSEADQNWAEAEQTSLENEQTKTYYMRLGQTTVFIAGGLVIGFLLLLYVGSKLV